MGDLGRYIVRTHPSRQRRAKDGAPSSSSVRGVTEVAKRRRDPRPRHPPTAGLGQPLLVGERGENFSWDGCAASRLGGRWGGVVKAAASRRTAKGSGGDDVVADGVEDEFGEGVEIELEHDVGAMSFGGVDADAEDGGDFLVAFAFGEELEDFAFARGKTGTVGFGRVVARIYGRGDAKGEVRLVLAEGVDGGEENTVGVVFEDIAAGAGFDDLTNEFIGFVHG